MSLKTKFNPMGSLGTKYYTLTINTNPNNATITFTADSYIAMQSNYITVKQGVIVQYEITANYYNTQTGTWTANNDETLNITLNPTEYTLTRPDFTGNGAVGTTTWAVMASHETTSTYAAWKAVDNSTSTYWCSNGSGSKSSWYKIYHVNKMKITKLVVKSVAGYSYGFAIKTISIKGSNDNSNWTTISCSLNSASSNNQIVTLTNTNFYKYYMLSMTHGHYSGFTDMQITGTYIKV